MRFVQTWFIFVLFSAKVAIATTSEEVKTLSPRIRVEQLVKDAEKITVADLSIYFANLRVSEKKFNHGLPFIKRIEHGRVAAGGDDAIYVAGTLAPMQTRFVVGRKGVDYYHPRTKEFLGSVMEEVADVRLERYLSPSTTVMRIFRSNKEVLVDDFIIQEDSHIFPYALNVTKPQTQKKGFILAAHPRSDSAVTNETVLFSLGRRENVKPGNLFNVYAGNTDKFKLPKYKEKIASLLVYRVYKKMSLALITNSTDIVKKSNLVMGK